MASEPIYNLRVNDVYKTLETSPDGLAAAEAESRRTLYGYNILSEQHQDPLWHKVYKHIVHPSVIILLIASLLALIQEDFILGGIILILTGANAAFSFWREYRAEQAVKKLQEILPAYAHVLRDGQDLHIPSREVVPGDLLILAEGDNIPADARVVEEYGLRTNNATLTGEAVPARKSSDSSPQVGISELERPNLIFAGTSVAAGTGRAIVYTTGMLTQFGRLAHLTQSVKEETSPVKKELDRITTFITLIALGFGAIIFIVGLTEGQMNMPWQELLLLTLGVIVAVIPEGLPATLTLSLAMAVQRLAQRGVLVKKLSTVETLGTISVICTDKSGTLTQNQMTVRDIWVAGHRLKVSGVGYEPQGDFSPDPKKQPWEGDLLTLLYAGLCCNNARVNPPTAENPRWNSLGDQTEAALKITAYKAHIDEKMLNATFPRVHEIPFDARRKRMTTIHREYDHELAFVKGAPREILQLCNNIQINDEIVELDNKIRADIMAANDEYARGALRVLAVAKRVLPLRTGKAYTPENVERDLTFLGLLAMMDPPRPEVERAVKTCRAAGIRIVMITGDYGLTAESLARRVGMLTTTNPKIITGAELEEMSETDLLKSLEGEVLFARMAPEHKMRMVALFQEHGDVVAVTGDGVNDAPALRKADVGIAMGVVGTDVAKEAADIILTNDNFSAIIAAIEEGRAVYDNVRKFISYIFASNVPEVLPFIISAMFPLMPLALRVRQIIAIDLGTDFLPALGLGVEKPEPDVMTRPPRKHNQPIIDNGLLARSFLWLGLIEAVLCYIAFFSVYLFSGNAGHLNIPFLSNLPFPAWLQLSLTLEQTEKMAVTVFHAGVVMAQIGNVFACRSELGHTTRIGWFTNKYIWLGIGAEIAGILSMIYVPFIAHMFGHIALPKRYWIGLASFGIILYGLEWIRKLILRTANKPAPESVSP